MDDPLDFRARNVLVVGGSSGIGNGIAQAFRARGATVCVWGTQESAAEYAGVEGSDLEGLGYARVDVADGDAIRHAPDPFPTLDVLVLSQGTVVYGRKEFEAEGWARVMAVNLDSLMVCANRFKPALAASRGSLIVISSIGGFRAQKANPAYAASKAGAIHLVRTLGQAWAPDGLRVNGVAPGMVDTKLTKVTFDRSDRRERTMAKIPCGRFGTPQDIAGAALFLASPLAAYMHGQTLSVDGGLSL